MDESGFESIPNGIYAWSTAWFYMVGKPDRSPSSKKGKKIYGDKQGKRGTRENLVAARRKGQKDLIAPMLFTGSLNAEGFEGWLSQGTIRRATAYCKP